MSERFRRGTAYVKEPWKNLVIADVKVEALSFTEDVGSRGRSDNRPDGSPIRAVAPPI